MANIQFGGVNRSFNRHKTSFRDFAAYVIVDQVIEAATPAPSDDTARLPQLPIEGAPPPTHRPAPGSDPESLPRTDLPIGIIGAGASGLYAAMILQDLGIDYQILESNNRIGGRIYTHRFNGQAGYDAPINTPARYDYFDVGAMRFPRIPFMDRVFDLFERIKIEDLLIEYRLSSPNTLQYFNTRPPLNSDIHSYAPKDDYFHVSEQNAGTVPNTYIERSVSDWTSDVYQHFKDLFGKLDDTPPDQRPKVFQKAWDELTMQSHHSTRGYMLSGKEGKPADAPDAFPTSVVEWLETFDSATGLYDEAFVESVIDSLDFDWPNPLRASPVHKMSNPPTSPSQKKDGADLMQTEWEWVCIDGGSDRMIHKMEDQLTEKPLLNRRVNKITLTPNKDAITVGFAHTKDVRTYSQVICTAPLGCLGAMDTDGLELLYNQKLAIRSLQYDASTKIGLKFERRWWEDPSVMGNATIKGGQSSTDLPIRTCVYPSYGLKCDNPPGVLLASYTWAQDARRLGGLAQGKGTPGDDILLELTVNNVAKLHGVTPDKMGPVVDHFAHSWYNDEHARGAFALFGPAQFGSPHSETPSIFTAIKAPGANGKFHIAGEATSAHHAWVLGSLNSAWRAVYNALNGRPDQQALLIKRWGIPDEESEVHLQKLSQLARYHRL